MAKDAIGEEEDEEVEEDRKLEKINHEESRMESKVSKLEDDWSDTTTDIDKGEGIEEEKETGAGTI